jgi:hypothetical protein
LVAGNTVMVGSVDLVMASESSIIRVSKLDAACRQLRTAITLWFTDGDPVSVHALTFAAYEVVHTVSKKRHRYRRDLLFDSALIKEEYRADFNKRVKQHAYFFKHADRDPEGVIDFNPKINEWLILFAITGRVLCGETQSREESAFLWWIQLHSPELLTKEGHEMVARHLSAETIQSIRRMSKTDFFEGFRDAEYLVRKYNVPARG